MTEKVDATRTSNNFPGATAGLNARKEGSGTLPGLHQHGAHAHTFASPAVSATLLQPLHCLARGCVFPPSEMGAGLCHFHDLEAEEPSFFESCQPIRIVLERAKFVQWTGEFEDDHPRRRRLVMSLRRAIQRRAGLKGALRYGKESK